MPGNNNNRVISTSNYLLYNTFFLKLTVGCLKFFLVWVPYWPGTGMILPSCWWSVGDKETWDLASKLVESWNAPGKAPVFQPQPSELWLVMDFGWGGAAWHQITCRKTQACAVCAVGLGPEWKFMACTLRQLILSMVLRLVESGLQ